MTAAVRHVLCPVDFSDASRAALRQAAAVAEYSGARLTILTVDDPLLAHVAAHADLGLPDETEQELRRFCADVLTHPRAKIAGLTFTVVVGKPASEILREADEGQVDLIVMSSQGRSGARKMFFGSTTERVLRETTVPVLVTPQMRVAIPRAGEQTPRLTRIVAPIDLSPASAHQAQVAARIAATLSVPLVLAHVLEPIFVPYNIRLAVSGVDTARREQAEERMAAIASQLPADVKHETVILVGDASEEITKLTDARHASLIVMGLHSSGVLGPRMGSVTYRVLCLSHAPVLALPPQDASGESTHA
jgi:nucleotide-binding universal stress UspA family protein